MTAEERAAFIISQSVVAMIEAMGMVAENDVRKHRGEAMAYDEYSFQQLIERSGIHHNAAVNFLQER